MDGSVISEASEIVQERGCEEKPSRRERNREHCDVIRKMAREGHNSSEIADHLGLKWYQVTHLAKKDGIQLAGSAGLRHLTVALKPRHVDVLDVLATTAGTSRTALLKRLLSAVFEAGPATATRLLGKDATPKRPYVRRQA